MYSAGKAQEPGGARDAARTWLGQHSTICQSLRGANARPLLRRIHLGGSQPKSARVVACMLWLRGAKHLHASAQAVLTQGRGKIRSPKPEPYPEAAVIICDPLFSGRLWVDVRTRITLPSLLWTSGASFPKAHSL